MTYLLKDPVLSMFFYSTQTVFLEDGILCSFCINFPIKEIPAQLQSIITWCQALNSEV